MKILNPDQRYLFSRPRGGLNDMLVQVEKSRQYAIRYERVLILDTMQSGLRLPFDDIFSVTESFGCEVMIWSEALAKEMDTIATVEPRALTNRISSYETYLDLAIKQVRDIDSDCWVSFDHTIDHSAQLLVYDQGGGGILGLYALRHMNLRSTIADEIAERLLPLGTDYDAIHVRNTDYRTDYEAQLAKCKTMFIGRKLLLCSDNATVKQSAHSWLDESTEILSVAEIPDIGGEPLHLSDDVDPYRGAVDLLSDLLAMARSCTFVFLKMSPTNNAGGKFSGFSILADLLRQEPATIQGLFAQASEQNISALFGNNSKNRRNDSTKLTRNQKFQRWIGRNSQWTWNFRARLRSLKNLFKIRRHS